MDASGSFKIVRTLASYFFSPLGHGKWAKTFFFGFSANYSNASPAGSENVVVFFSAYLFFLTPQFCKKNLEI